MSKKLIKCNGENCTTKEINPINFYKSSKPEYEKYDGFCIDYCKSCLKKMCTDVDGVIKALGILGKEFNEELYLKCKSKGFDLGVYLKELIFVGNKVENKEIDFNTGVVEFLKREEKSLREKADKMLDNGDFAMYTKIIHAYENVVTLIKKYDWELKYSEYYVGCDTTDCVSTESKQVAIWEQNGDGQVRNHKVWNVQDLVGIKK